MARFLAALTVYKATADVGRGGRMFEEQSSVPDDMLPWRSTVIAFKQPRRQLVQPCTRLERDTVLLQVAICSLFVTYFSPFCSRCRRI